MDKHLKRTSKFLSLVLRHQPDVAGLSLDEGGWVEVTALLEGARQAGIRLNRARLETIVAQNDK